MERSKRKLIFIFLLLFLALFSTRALAKERLLLFWSYGCPHCAKVESFIKGSKVDRVFGIEQKEISSQENILAFREAVKKCNLSLDRAGVPLLVIAGNKCLLGDEAIIGYFKTKIPSREKQKADSQPKNGGKLSLPLIVGAALADSINPCAFAVLIVLLSTILISKKRKQAILAGLSFTLAIYLAYLLMGLTGWRLLLSADISFYLVKAAGILAVILGLLNLKDAFDYGSLGFVMEVPFSWRPSLKKIISFVRPSKEPCKVCTNKCVKEPLEKVGKTQEDEIAGKFKFVSKLPIALASFMVGLAISLFLLPCTSGPYIVILGLLSQSKTFYLALRYLILYNFVFVLPMVVITLLIGFGLDPKKIEKARKKKIKLIHLLIAIILLAIGIYVLLFF